jgi:hypothetical protein
VQGILGLEDLESTPRRGAGTWQSAAEEDFLLRMDIFSVIAQGTSMDYVNIFNLRKDKIGANILCKS